MKKVLKTALNILKWILIGLLGLVILLLILIYLPPVQDFAVRKALESVNSSGDMKIEVAKLRLLPPLRLKVDSVSVESEAFGFSAAELRTNIGVLALVRAQADVSRLTLNGASLRINNPDSLMYMTATLDSARIDDAVVGLLNHQIEIQAIKLQKGDIDMRLLPDSVARPSTPSQPLPWHIDLRKGILSDINYSMQMLPTIDSLAADIPLGIIDNAQISLADSRIDVRSISIRKPDITYLTPTAEYIAEHPAPVIPEDTTAVASTPWTINVNALSLSDGKALYATVGATPLEGFDPQYIEASQINIAIDSLYNRGAEIKVPIKEIAARERCGISLKLTGLFEMDSTAMHARDMVLTTPVSRITLDAMMGLEAGNPPLKANLEANISPTDIILLAPPAARPIALSLPRYQPLLIGADIEGRMNNLEINTLYAEIPRHVRLELDGEIADYNDLNIASGDISIHGSMPDANFIKPALLDAKMGKTINIPPTTLSGGVSLAHGIIDGDLQARTHGGDIALDASWNNRREGYDIDLTLNTFPIQNFMPTLGARNIDAQLTAKGESLDIFSKKAHAQLGLILKSAEYEGHRYSDITLDATLADGKAEIAANSANPVVNFSLNAAGNLDLDSMNWNFNGDIRNLNLKALALTDSVCEGTVKLSGTAIYRPAIAKTRRKPGIPMGILAQLEVSDLRWKFGGDKFSTSKIALDFRTDSTTEANLTNNDLSLALVSPQPLDSITRRLGLTSLVLDYDMKRHRANVDTLQRAMPKFNLDFKAGTNNIVASYLQNSGMSINRMSLNASNDSLINMSAVVSGIISGKTRIDTITADIHQQGSYLNYLVAMNNRPGTFDEFAKVSLRGYFNDNHLSLILNQQNVEGNTGYSIGAVAALADSIVNLRFVPYHPIIGYKDWEVNRDNLISFDLKNQHLDANLNLFNHESSVKLYTEHPEGADHSAQEDLVLEIKDIQLADWIAINPFAPPITGSVSANMRVAYHKPDINGNGRISLKDFNYGKRKVGDFDLDVEVMTNAAGTIRANTTLIVDGMKTITASGNINDSTAINPFLLDFRMIHFPLKVLNPFLPQETAQLSGTINGQMDITGALDNPVFNGFVNFDSTEVNAVMLGTKFRFSPTQIPVKNSLITFNDFQVHGVNENPLHVNGTVDITSMISGGVDLHLQANNMQVVGSQKQRFSQVYGKAFVDLDATARGSFRFLRINANLDILAGTNVTYIMADAQQAIASRGKQEMVKFVNFADTTAVLDADSIAPQGMLTSIDARLGISEGTTITVDLDTNGKNKVQIQPSGTVNYTQDFMNDQRCTGRININKGFVRYSLPVIGEKLFNFQEGSYVGFNGDMLNPILNVQAVDEVRANVAQDGNNSRVVNFDVGLGVTGTLEQMNVAFDLSCPDDLTITNELKSMTPEQRANQAMNLLLYGTYRSGGTETVTSGSMGTNALYSFLESQINSWASGIKGVDLSFGINQYDKTVDGANTSAMSYSYRVSKSLFDDRFKIVVGGNYTTDADADENFAQNLIADISFEYLLNKQGTMYVRLFRHTGYESILEGEITQTGVGFVYKKKIHRLLDIFRPAKKSDNNALIQQAPPPASPSSPGSGNKDAAGEPVETRATEPESTDNSTK